MGALGEPERTKIVPAYLQLKIMKHKWICEITEGLTIQFAL